MPSTATKGRPRKAVASLDAEAAERRRTQLRVAQRAFRKRREATTEELREQVSDLQNVHDGLLSSIRDLLKDSSMKEGDGALADALESLLAKYTSSQEGDNGESKKVAAPAAQQHVDMGNVLAPVQGDNLSIIDTSYGTNNSLLTPGLPFDLFWTAPIDLNDLFQPLQPIGYDEAPFSIRLRRRGIQAGYQ
jgi:uncharacterized protein YqeY